jgi:hypothetical protein
MTPTQINKAIDKYKEQSRKINEQFIDAGRGNERPSEYLRKNDPLKLYLLHTTSGDVLLYFIRFVD